MFLHFRDRSCLRVFSHPFHIGVLALRRCGGVRGTARACTRLSQGSSRVSFGTNRDRVVHLRFYTVIGTAISILLSSCNVNEFKNICSYLGDQHIYEDYQSACSFVHGQDITSKTLPFTFYVSICYRFNMMMNYIFRTIHLFPLNEALENQLMSLEDELIELLEKYYQ